jgi:hypothetical protein
MHYFSILRIIADGDLSLRRLSLDKHFVREQGLGMVAAAASVQTLGVTSISLPGMGGAGWRAGFHLDLV